jgi:ligand-binding SRPBCC domain-containing protein
METIRVTTWIDAPVERCFQLSRSIDLHVASASSTHEEAIDGVTSGLIAEGETVTLRGRHLLLQRKHVSRIEVLRPSAYIREVMVAGSFRHFEHDHHFATMDDGTRIREEIHFSLKWGVLGRLATRLYVRKHLLRMLHERNAFLKQVAESDGWHQYLDGSRDVTTTMVVQKAAGEWDKRGALRGSRS